MNGMSQEEKRTAAFKVFEKNMAHIGFVQEAMKKGTEQSIPLMHQIAQEGEAIKKIEGAERAAAAEVVLAKAAAMAEKYFGGLTFAREWMCVMLLTFLQAYHEDSFVRIAEKDADIMDRVRPLGSDREIKGLTLDEMRRLWAQKAMQGKGPKGWFKHFAKEGVHNYREQDIQNMQYLFASRNLIVHAAGKASDDYINQYPRQMVLSEQIKVTQSTSLLWSVSAWNLVKATDEYMLRYEDETVGITGT